ncbi:MAG: hypothetical protein ACKV2U_22500 [Bryobacteraceae bacterium]
MEREQLDRLLAEYATGGLSDGDKKKLFAAALADQDLFEQLMEEDALREAIEMPGARNRLVESLREEAAERRPAGAARRPMWLAWATGIGVVLVSGAITYMMFDRPVAKDLAAVRPVAAPPVKEFVPPAKATAPKPRLTIVDEPPKIMAEQRAPMASPLVMSIPLPKAPPPPEAVPAKAADVALSAREERDQVRMKFRPQQQDNIVLPAPSMPVLGRRPAGMGGADGSVAREMKAPVNPFSVWRRTGDGIWIRVPTGETIGRNESIAIHYTPVSSPTVVLLDGGGRRVLQTTGRVGEELVLLVPQVLLDRAETDSLTLSVLEDSRSTANKIFLRLK